jgi:hypothetical protein
MSRNLIIVALIGLLAACTAQGDGDNTGASIEPAPSVAASAPASANASPDASADSSGTSGTASAACTDAFTALEGQDATSLSDLADLEGIEATIEQCESIDDWMAGASAVIGDEVNPSTVNLLLQIRCEVPALSDSAVCEEVASS